MTMYTEVKEGESDYRAYYFCYKKIDIARMALQNIGFQHMRTISVLDNFYELLKPSMNEGELWIKQRIENEKEKWTVSIVHASDHLTVAKTNLNSFLDLCQHLKTQHQAENEGLRGLLRFATFHTTIEEYQNASGITAHLSISDFGHQRKYRHGSFKVPVKVQKEFSVNKLETMGFYAGRSAIMEVLRSDAPGRYFNIEQHICDSDLSYFYENKPIHEEKKPHLEDRFIWQNVPSLPQDFGKY